MHKLPTVLALGVLLMACNPDQDAKSLVSQSQVDLASKAADPELLKLSVGAIAANHRSKQTGNILNPGATSESIAEFEDSIRCKLPRELVELWKWRNGEKTSNFIWYHRFLSIEESQAQYTELTKEGWSLWQPDWVPIFEFEGEWYGVKCGDQRKDASPVVFYFVEQEPVIAYVNLSRYMQTMAEAMAANTLSWDESAWDEDIQLLARTHSQLNPGIKFPYFVPDER